MFRGESGNKPKNNGISYVTAVGIVFIEVLLSAAWLGFSVFYTEFVELRVASTTQTLWIPIIVISIRTISNPLTRKICEHFSDNDYDNYRFTITISSLTVAVIIILGACSRLILIQALTYGIFCGLSSSLISNQLKDATYEDFQSRPQLFEGLQQVAKALSLFLMPHIFYCLVTNYGVYEAEFLFAALLLHIIPLSMIVKRKQRCAEPNLSKYRTVSTLHNDKTPALPTVSHTFGNFSITEDDSSSSDDEELHIRDLEVPTNPVTVVNTIVPLHRKHFVGVDILPEIPEEEEVEEEDAGEKIENIQTETMKDSISQYSRLSARFEDLISSEVNDYQAVTSNSENSAQKFISNKRYRFKQYIKCGCSPYQNYLYKKRLNKIVDFFCETLLKPLWKALRVFAFYPCLLTKVLMMLTSVIYVVFVPHLAITTEEEEHPSQSAATDSAMLLSLMAFPWLCLLVFLPWLLNSNRNKLKAIFCAGIVTLGISTFLVNLRLNYDVIATASLLFGTSYGGLELSQEIVFKEIAGVQKWRIVKDPIDVISGLCVIGLYGAISAFDVSVLKVLGGNTVFSMLLASVWLFIFLKDKFRFVVNVGL